MEDITHHAGAFEQHAWLRSPATVLHGHCGVTDVGPSDCAIAERGSWPATTMDDCVARCLACENCNFVSLSTDPGNQDCSWFSKCHLGAEKLLHPNGDVPTRVASTFETYAVAEADAH